MFRIQVWEESSRVYQDVRVRFDHIGVQGYVAQPGVPATEYDTVRTRCSGTRMTCRTRSTSSGALIPAVEKRFFDNADFPPEGETEE